MPQARSGGSRSGSTSRSRSGSGSGRSKRSTSGSSTASNRAKRSSSRRTSSSRSTASGRSTTSGRSTQRGSSSNAAEAQLEAVAQRLRKLNERIIAAGKDAGETTLSSYEKALKAIANAVERGPGSSDVDWISNLATTQAKFIREVTTAWAAAARDMLK